MKYFSFQLCDLACFTARIFQKLIIKINSRSYCHNKAFHLARVKKNVFDFHGVCFHNFLRVTAECVSVQFLHFEPAIRCLLLASVVVQLFGRDFYWDIRLVFRKIETAKELNKGAFTINVTLWILNLKDLQGVRWVNQNHSMTIANDSFDGKC